MVSIYSSQGLTRASTLSYARLKPGKRVRAEQNHFLNRFKIISDPNQIKSTRTTTRKSARE